jgi:hypothetical protein
MVGVCAGASIQLYEDKFSTSLILASVGASRVWRSSREISAMRVDAILKEGGKENLELADMRKSEGEK